MKCDTLMNQPSHREAEENRHEYAYEYEYGQPTAINCGSLRTKQTLEIGLGDDSNVAGKMYQKHASPMYFNVNTA